MFIASSPRLLRLALAAGLVLGGAIPGLWTSPARAQQAPPPAFETAAPTAILIDHGTGTVLFEKNADQPTPPASLAKLMTVEVLFDLIEQGRLKPEDVFTVSEHAWRTGGGASGGLTMFLKLGSQVSVEDLIRGIIIQSGNDATIVAAEGVAGSEAAFAAMMNRRAQEIGLKTARFANPHGLPHPDQRVSMRDFAALAAHLIRTYPERYKLFAQGDFTYNGIKQANRNPLLDLGIGADGLKTGHTAESGYGLVASAERDGQRLTLAMNGMKSSKERAAEARKLMEWGFRAFEQVTLFPAGKPVGEARVFGGARGSVPLVGREDIKALVPRGTRTDDLESRIVYQGPLEAPVRQGDRVGTLKVSRGGSIVQEVPLQAGEGVERGSIVRRAWDAALELFGGQVRDAWAGLTG